MADINQVITLGIGTPAGVPEFLTFGLQIGTATEGTIIIGDVAIRLTAEANTNIRQTTAGNVAIRQTTSGDVEL